MLKNQRGITLVELMIVVAIVAILAALGSIAYGRYVKAAKIEKLNQYAMDIQSGEERFRARNNVYWTGGVLTSASTQAIKDNYANLLDFGKALPEGVTAETEAWVGGGAGCTICQGAPFDAARSGYAVVVTQDLNASETENTTVIVTNSTENPILLHEGL